MATFACDGNLPGYGGFCPTVKGSFGSTYGNATKSYTLFSRKEELSTSRWPQSRRAHGAPPLRDTGAYTARPCSASATNSEMWLQPLPYSLHHTGARRTEILSFSKFAQKHRQFYKDHTGMEQSVSLFSHRRHGSAPLMKRVHCVVFEPHINSIHGRALSYTNRVQPTHGQLNPQQPSARDRTIRDLYFEKR